MIGVMGFEYFVDEVDWWIFLFMVFVWVEGKFVGVVMV